MSNYKPLFITLEGVDGCGKSTLIGHLRKYIETDLGAEVVQTKEPGASLGGATIRELLFKTPGTKAMFPGQADCLMLYDHIGTSLGIVEPALQAGKWVICDRYADSQFAYMVGRDVPPAINDAYYKCYGRKPDITFLLIGDVMQFSMRAKARDLRPDAMEPGKQQGKAWGSIEAQKRIQDAYLVNLSNQPRTIILNITGKNEHQVAEMAITAMLAKLNAPIPPQNQSLFERL